MKIRTIFSAALMLVTAAVAADAQVVVSPTLTHHGIVNSHAIGHRRLAVAPGGFFLRRGGSTVLGDHLRGAAAVRHARANQVRARGEFLQRREAAREQAIANRRASNVLRKEEQDARAEYIASRRSDTINSRANRSMQRYVHQPKSSVIQSGSALNFIVEKLRIDPSSYGLQSLTLSEGDFNAINLQLADGFSLRGADSLISGTGYLVWPASLQGDEFAIDRQAVEELISSAMTAAQNGAGVEQYRDSLQTQLEAFTGSAVASMGTKAFREAKEFTKNLELTMAHLNDEAVEVLSHRPATLGDLVEYMKANNLTFAPTDDAGLHVYNRLHTTLAAQLEAPSPV